MARARWATFWFALASGLRSNGMFHCIFFVYHAFHGARVPAVRVCLWCHFSKQPTTIVDRSFCLRSLLLCFRMRYGCQPISPQDPPTIVRSKDCSGTHCTAHEMTCSLFFLTIFTPFSFVSSVGGLCSVVSFVVASLVLFFLISVLHPISASYSTLACFSVVVPYFLFQFYGYFRFPSSSSSSSRCSFISLPWPVPSSSAHRCCVW